MEMPVQTVKDKFTSRKFIVFIVLFVIATVALFMDVADFTKWAEFVKWLFGIYAASNAIVAGSRAIVINNGGESNVG